MLKNHGKKLKTNSKKLKTYGKKQSKQSVITEHTRDSPQPISDTVIILSCCSTSN